MNTKRTLSNTDNEKTETKKKNQNAKKYVTLHSQLKINNIIT